MKNINTFYNLIIWTSTLSTLVGCIYNQKNGMIGHTDSVKEKSVYYSYDRRIYRFNDHDTVLKELISLEDKMKQCLIFFKEKLVGKNYQNELMYTHDGFHKSSHNIVDENGNNITQDLFKDNIGLGSIRNKIIKKIKEINFDPKNYIKNRLAVVNEASSSTDLPFYRLKNEKKIVNKQKNKIACKTLMESIAFNKEGSSSYLSSEINSGIDECKDYWCRVFLQFVRYGTNGVKDVYAKCEKHIMSFAKEAYHEQYDAYIARFIQIHSTRHNRNNLVYDPKVIIKKLEELRLQPLENSYDELSSLVMDPRNYFDDTVRQKAKDILDILYNILYSYAIVDVMDHMITMPLFANSSKNHDLKNTISPKEALVSSYVWEYKLLLMKASLGIESADNIDKMNISLTNLKKIGLSDSIDYKRAN